MAKATQNDCVQTTKPFTMEPYHPLTKFHMKGIRKKFIYYAKKPTKGEKVKDKLKLKKYNPNTRKHEFFVEKKLPPHSK